MVATGILPVCSRFIRFDLISRFQHRFHPALFLVVKRRLSSQLPSTHQEKTSILLPCKHGENIAKNLALERRLNSQLPPGHQEETSIPCKNNENTQQTDKQQRPVRVRFAPSPTGYLHIGGLRAALINYLFALANDGTFVLRSEDTDRTRFVSDSVGAMEQTLEWLGIRIHEGPSKPGPYGPYYQSERTELYHDTVDRLVEMGKAYRCFCTPERLALLKYHSTDGVSVKRGYDNKCRNLAPDEVKRNIFNGIPYTVRFAMDDSVSTVDDLVYGRYTHHIADLESDPIILKSDGFPTYHLANVVDDHAMRISHVIRGEEWMTSSVKHLQLYKALGWAPPVFAHVPNLLDETGQKISKRRGGGYQIDTFREAGVMPEVLCNYVVRLGHKMVANEYLGDDFSKVLSMDELAKAFPLLELSHHRYKVVPGDVFALNGAYLRAKPKSELLPLLRDALEKRSFGSPDRFFDDYLTKVIALLLHDKRFNTVNDFFHDEFMFLWKLPDPKPAQAFLAFSAADHGWEVLRGDIVHDSPTLTNPGMFQKAAKNIAKVHKLKPKVTLTFLRLALTGVESGPKIGDILAVLGPEESAKRISGALFTEHCDKADVC